MTHFMSSMQLLLAATAVLAVINSVDAAAATAKACNGSPDYCPLAFDQYTFMGSHNSAAYRLEPGCGIASKCRVLNPLARCLWDNQPEHDIATQLKDGIRSFDIDTCIANSNTVTCHGHNMFRALGDGLDVHIKQIKEFITQNPNEVIVIEYGDYLGDKNKTSNDIIAKLREHLDGKMLERTSISESWPTLDEMTKQGKQVVVFFGDFIPDVKKRPAWIHDRLDYIDGSWDYVKESNKLRDLTSSFERHAKNTPETVKKWQCVDFVYSTNVGSWIDQMKKHKKPGICLDSVAKEAFGKLSETTKLYSDKYPHVHRVKIDHYFGNLGSYKAIIKDMNTKNINRFSKK